MKDYTFKKGFELLALCGQEGISIGEAMFRREIEESEHAREDVLAEMKKNLEVMRASVKEGLKGELRSVSGLTGGDAAKLHERAEADKSLSGKGMLRAVAASMAVVEVNASMGRIVAAPTAGASGILPGTLLTCARAKGWDDEALLLGLFNAGAVGLLIARNAGISGAEGGCQAETGAAAAMAASALTELSGGAPGTCLHAAAMALKNVMGLVCDPVAGLVECPCIKRNAIGAANALVSADMALVGIESLIPFDEVVTAMKSVGRLMSPDLRETAKGGVAATPTARAIAKQLEE
ncbi:MAG TPA: L-serine ammonia-lyase, iron-sulfur-dependent, subunit alpha [Clostridia bacterium]|nr:L-serine ammonia-lyase, iron-sulfur-dependent, subunit alpha [Clostridia bacterium]